MKKFIFRSECHEEVHNKGKDQRNAYWRKKDEDFQKVDEKNGMGREKAPRKHV